MPAYALEILVVVLGLTMLLLEAFLPKANAKGIGAIGIVGLLVALVMMPFTSGAPAEGAGAIWDYYAADQLAYFYKGLALLATILTLVIGIEYLPVLKKFTARGEGGSLGEFFCIPVFVCAGMMWMASAIDLTSIFVSLELVTISFYILVAYMRRNVGSMEAGVKYLVLGALSTGFFVYGITWLFGMTGETSLAGIRTVLEGGLEGKGILFAFALIMVGLGFKVAAVPFQIWTPDVYQGAPTPITAYLAVGSKAAGFIVLTRMVAPFLESGVLDAELGTLTSKVAFILAILAGASLLYGSLGAIPQTNAKRLLAFSGISHAGFLLTALACSFPVKFGMYSASVVGFYLAAYLPAAMAAFLILALVRRDVGGEDLKSLNGLGERSPFLGFVLLIAIASLAGIPLTAGFTGKFFIINLAIDQGRYVIFGFAILAAAIGFYYYFKFIRAIYWEKPEGDAVIQVSGLSRIVLLILAAAIFLLFFSPNIILGKLPNPDGVAAAVEGAGHAGH